MLKMPQTLLFPTITHLGKIQFKNLPSSLKTSLYKIDWSKIEEIKYNNWKKQLNCSPSPVVYCDTLPAGIKTWANDMQFALSEEYLQEIRHCSTKAAEEWNRERPIAHQGIDPAIGPTISYVDTAFQLLSDCLYDPETNYFSRSGEKLIAPYALICRFWAYQTSCDNVIQRVNLPHLQSLIQNLKNEDKDTYHSGIEISRELQDHFRLIKYNTPNTKKAKAATNTQVSDFFNNTEPSVTLKDTTINVPDIGELHLIKPVLNRSRGKIILKAEFKCKNMNIPTGITFDFFIQGLGISTFFAKHATITSISATPPPEITIEIQSLQHDRPSKEGEVSKIDLNKIKKICDQETLAIDEIVIGD